MRISQAMRVPCLFVAIKDGSWLALSLQVSNREMGERRGEGDVPERLLLRVRERKIRMESPYSTSAKSC